MALGEDGLRGAPAVHLHHHDLGDAPVDHRPRQPPRGPHGHHGGHGGRALGAGAAVPHPGGRHRGGAHVGAAQLHAPGGNPLKKSLKRLGDGLEMVETA